METAYKSIADYGLIGNGETCALVGDDGSIDWFCAPRLNSKSIFAALLDEERGGHFRIRPAGNFSSIQKYHKRTNILHTQVNTSLGEAVITDFMPYRDVTEAPTISMLVRRVECTGGNLRFEIDYKPRPEYGMAKIDLVPQDNDLLCKWNDNRLLLQSPVPLYISESEAYATFEMKDGDVKHFVLFYNCEQRMEDYELEALREKVEAFWTEWVERRIDYAMAIDGHWREFAIRSGLALKLLISPRTGAIAAAPTTSLPEVVGGIRNWDYRYAWIRDVAFTFQALFHLGHIEESDEFATWVHRLSKHTQKPGETPVLYLTREEPDMSEQPLNSFGGYKNSAPVRIGNAASTQRQLDSYGEMINAIYDTSRYGKTISEDDWPAVRAIVENAAKDWKEKDNGIWEMRTGQQHFTHSKLMCWLAVDRGIKLAREQNFDAPVARWQKAADEIKQAILENGYNERMKTFVQAFGSTELDASLLLFAFTDFLPVDDPRIQNTINAVMENLMTKEGLVYRYRVPDGLPGQEGAFVLCSFWLIKALAISGRVQEAETLFECVTRHASPLGLFSEEVDPETGELLGNYPQAYSQIGVINAALYLGVAKGRTVKGPGLFGIA